MPVPRVNRPAVNRPAVTVSDLDTMPIAAVSITPADATSARKPLSRQVIGLAALMWLATRIAYLAITYFPVNHLGPNLETTSSRLTLWSRFDANWYISIAQHGYGPRASFAFYPLYPLLIHGLDSNPFQTLDREGVGRLVRIATEEGRAANPDLEVGICGEHGGDPDSIAFCNEIGLNYVSCSPFRVPKARLAAAQAVLAGAEKDK